MPAATQHQTKTDPELSDNWRTPPWVLERATKRFGPFEIDAAADKTNHLYKLWFGPGSPWMEDALDGCWNFQIGNVPVAKRVWVNPPYSRGWVEKFLAKAREEVDNGNCRSATLLIPADTSTGYWHRWVWDEQRNEPRKGVVLDLLPRRVRFLRPDGTQAGTPPFGSALVHMFSY